VLLQQRVCVFRVVGMNRCVSITLLQWRVCLLCGCSRESVSLVLLQQRVCVSRVVDILWRPVSLSLCDSRECVFLVLLQQRECVSRVVAAERVFLSCCCSRESVSLVLLQQRECVSRVVDMIWRVALTLLQ